MTDPDSWDGFISYSHTDSDWVRMLAENLHRLGVDVWFDEWEVRPGDVLARAMDRGLAASRNGILVVGRDALEKAFVLEEYAALWYRAVTEGIRLIPLVIADVKLPPLLASRVWIDFRDDAHYDANLRRLVAAVTDQPVERPARDGGVDRPDGARIEGPRTVRLHIDAGSVTLSRPDGSTVAGPVPGLSEGDMGVLRGFEAARQRHPSGVAVRTATGTGTVMDAGPGEVGRILRRGLVPADVGERLDALVRESDAQLGSLRLAIETGDDLADLPWETVEVDGQPAALHPRVSVYRVTPAETVPVVTQIPRPLRILAAIASPDDGEGDLLDYERELETIVRATDTAHGSGGAFVKILEFGTLQAIEAELRQTRFHVLYLSGHAEPGAFTLENPDGTSHQVTAEQLVAAIPNDRLPPLVVLAGCLTARGSVSSEGDGTAQSLPGLGRDLNRRGIPTVVAMTAPVTDGYATDLAGGFFESLLAQPSPEPIAAIAQARRQLEERRRDLPDADPAKQHVEWPTPVLLTSGTVFALFDPESPSEHLTHDPPPSLDASISNLGGGEFVGRRRAIRQAIAPLRDGQKAVVVHGLGGVGKSTFGARLLRDLPGRITVGVDSRNVSPDTILADIASELRTRAAVIDQAGVADTIRNVATLLSDATIPWDERLDILDRFVVQREVRLLLLLDNFEDALVASEDGHRIAHAEVEALLASWVPIRGCGLIVTSRFPFPVDGLPNQRIVNIHLGPLIFPEAVKLIRRLPALDALSWEAKLQAWQQVGGHPRTLEYLDALLRGGETPDGDLSDAAYDRFERVTARLSERIETIGADPAVVMAASAGSFDVALSEAITRAADDVLLTDLLALLAEHELGDQVLLAVAVHRRPVDVAGIAFGVGEERNATEATDRYRSARQQFIEAMEGAESDEERTESWKRLPEQVRDAVREGPPVPRSLPDTAPAALAAAIRLGLITPVGDGHWFVHRWTATALSASHFTAGAVVGAHRRAADYYQWRVEVWPQDRQDDVADLFEARHHQREAGDLDAALESGGVLAAQLTMWGRYSDAQVLMEDNLRWAPDHDRRGAWIHQLGILAQRRGDYQQAETWYHQSLTIKEELGNRAGLANSYGQLGILAQNRGDYEQAEDWYRQALTIEEELGDRTGLATSYHNLGTLAQRRGDYEQAETWYRQSLTIEEQLGNRAGLANSYHQLGILAQDRGDYQQAEDWYRQALTIEEELGYRAGLATSYHNLGILAQHRGDYEQAEDWYRQALTIEEELGNRAGLASTISQMGLLAAETGRIGDSIGPFLDALATRLAIGSGEAGIDLHNLSLIRRRVGADSFTAELRQHLDEDDVAGLLALLDQYGTGDGDVEALDDA